MILSDNSGSADKIIVPYEKRIKFVIKFVFEVEMLDAGMQADVTGVFAVFSYTIASLISLYITLDNDADVYRRLL